MYKTFPKFQLHIIFAYVYVSPEWVKNIVKLN